jgi:receptor protein-tyrosine kinase
VADSNVIPAVAAGNAAARRGRQSIGAILIDAGRLNAEDAERIVRLQREKGLRFGDAAIELGLLVQADIEFALSRQFEYPYLLRGQSAISEDLVAAYTPFSPQVEALRAVRGQLVVRWFDGDPGHKALAIVSAGRREGRSFIAANLAVVFSQLGERTLLIDADLRNPRLHDLFALDNRTGLSAMLSGRGGPDAVQRVDALVDLSVLPAGTVPPNPAELLARPPFEELLQSLAARFDVIILDTPAAGESADAQCVAMRAGGALIVARKNETRIAQVQGVTENLVHAKATVVGVLLNEF